MLRVITVVAVCLSGATCGQTAALTDLRLKEREKRFELFGGVCVDWHTAALDLDAKTSARLSELFHRLAVANHEAWKKGISDDFRYFYFAGKESYGARSLIDGERNASGPSAWDTGLRETVAATGNTRLHTVLAERVAYLEQQAIEAMVGVYDQRVYLTADHRDEVARVLRQMLAGRLSQPFPLYSERTIFAHARDPKLKTALGEGAAAVLQRVGDSELRLLKCPMKIRCVSNDTPGQRLENITNSLAPSVVRLRGYLADRIKRLGHRFDLSESQMKKLATAAKGVEQRSSKRWRAELGPRMTEMGDRVRKRGGQATPMTLSTSLSVSIQEEPIWVSAINRVLVGKAPDRKAARAAMVSQMMLALDQELWLRPDQRDGLRQLVDSAVQPLTTNHIRNQANIALSQCLHGIPPDSLAGVLTPRQLEVWGHLQRLPKAPSRTSRTTLELGGLGPRRP